MNPLEKFIAKYEELEKKALKGPWLPSGKDGIVINTGLTDADTVVYPTDFGTIGFLNEDDRNLCVFARNSAKQVIEMLKFLSFERQCYTPDEWKNLDRLAEEGMGEL